jgi:hypothetical protein
MRNHDLYKRFVDTYRLLCDDIDRLDKADVLGKEIVLGDLGCDLSYLRGLIDEVYGEEEPANNNRARRLAEIKKKDCKIKYTWTERILFWVVLLFGCIGGGFAGHIVGNFIKTLLGL